MYFIDEEIKTQLYICTRIKSFLSIFVSPHLGFSIGEKNMTISSTVPCVKSCIHFTCELVKYA